MRTRKPIKAYLREKRKALKNSNDYFTIDGSHLVLTCRDIAEICGMRVEVIESTLERISLAVMEDKTINLEISQKSGKEV